LHQTRRLNTAGGTAGGGAVGHGGGSSDIPLFVGLGVVVALIAVAFGAWRRLAPLGPEAQLAELERALSRSGRPLANGVTLAAVEQRFRTSPEAAAYIRRLRLVRFAGGTEVPTLGQRRALRAQLRAGLGLGGALRALWALPPRPRRRPGRD
jgi:protein-glutamine gamma-glutamyltransferase